jgi:hypothetical protein
MNRKQSTQIHSNADATYMHHLVTLKETVCSKSVEKLKYFGPIWQSGQSTGKTTNIRQGEQKGSNVLCLAIFMQSKTQIHDIKF